MLLIRNILELKTRGIIIYMHFSTQKIISKLFISVLAFSDFLIFFWGVLHINNLIPIVWKYGPDFCLTFIFM